MHKFWLWIAAAFLSAGAAFGNLFLLLPQNPEFQPSWIKVAGFFSLAIFYAAVARATATQEAAP